jgi:hypothetical protein
MEPRRGETPISINRLGIMTARLRIIVAASACLLSAGAPALAQDSAQQTSPPPQTEVVGPPQLSNFSLNGTVTRAAPAPAPARSRSPQQSSTQRPAPATSNRTAAPDQAADRAQSLPAAPATSDTTVQPRPEPKRESLVSESAAPPATDTVSLAPAEATDSLPAAPSDVPTQAVPGSVPMLPWILAALAAAAAGAWLVFSRLRPRESYAGVSDFDLAESPPKAAEPETKPLEPVQPKPAPPPPAVPGGVVSTRLRPWLEIEFKPDRAVVDDNRAAVAFEISVLNSGSVPARDVLLEASLFNAGPMQDQQIKLFFDNPVAKGDRIPVIPPLQRVTVNTAVFLARDQVRPIEIEGRPLFVPMVAFNALYRWSGGEGQTSASYLVGKQTKGDKLAPFRLDLGPRIFRGLEGREHELRVRN